ncbi:hypothetical protein CDD83_633 [Cordyceps sp. RAO-2017]|nr:hypothetical protein CDD83_633 [Cordyceps sp. RAO-2017]
MHPTTLLALALPLVAALPLDEASVGGKPRESIEGNLIDTVMEMTHDLLTDEELDDPLTKDTLKIKMGNEGSDTQLDPIDSSSDAGAGLPLTSAARPAYTPSSAGGPKAIPGRPTTVSKAQTGPTQSPSSQANDDSPVVLVETNNFRELHGAKPLTWDAELASRAQKWADKCESGHTPQEEGQERVGQNIFQQTGSGGDEGWKSAVKYWSGEEATYRSLFRYEREPTMNEMDQSMGSNQFLHFTQLVWQETTTLGCGTADCTSKPLGSYNYVCNYYKAGNMRDGFLKNVKRPAEKP